MIVTRERYLQIVLIFCYIQGTGHGKNATNSPHHGKRISRAGSVDTLSPCESIASDDLILDYEHSDASSYEEQRFVLYRSCEYALHLEIFFFTFVKCSSFLMILKKHKRALDLKSSVKLTTDRKINIFD